MKMIAKKELDRVKESLKDSDILEWLVEELYIGKAEEVNKRGLESQLTCLLSEGWFKDLDQIVKFIQEAAW